MVILGLLQFICYQLYTLKLLCCPPLGFQFCVPRQVTAENTAIVLLPLAAGIYLLEYLKHMQSRGVVLARYSLAVQQLVVKNVSSMM